MPRLIYIPYFPSDIFPRMAIQKGDSSIFLVDAYTIVFVTLEPHLAKKLRNILVMVRRVIMRQWILQFISKLKGKGIPCNSNG